MKKLLFLLVATAITLTFGCSKDDDTTPLKVDTSPITIMAGDSIQIQAESSKEILYSLTNSYVGSITEDGWFKPLRIGTGEIEVTSNSDSKKIPFEVNPKYNTYEEPLTDWDLTESEFINNYDGFIDMRDGTHYKAHASGKAVLFYNFETGTLQSALLAFKIEYVEDVMNFVLERYIPTTYEGDIYLFRDNIEPDECQTLVAISSEVTYLDGELVFKVLYYPASENKKSIQEVKQQILSTKKSTLK